MGPRNSARRKFSSDSVPTPGLYPMRLVAGDATGGANLEWFSVQPDGTKILVNDVANTNALRAFRARTAITAPSFNPPTLSAQGVVLSWTGIAVLAEASAVNGPWSRSANQTNPQTVPAVGGMRFYRLEPPQ